MIRLPFLLSIFFLISNSLICQKLNSDEKKVVTIVDKNMTEAINFLEKIVNINSSTNNSEGVREVGDVFKVELDALGFETNWIEMPAEMKRAGHLFGELNGTMGKRLLLMGHLDTVFEPGENGVGFVRKDSIAFGPGVNDMKGGDVVILFALKALHEANLLNGTQLILAYHGDEESPGAPFSVSRRDIIEAAKRSDIALSFEAVQSLDLATIARKGNSGWTLSVRGNQAHSSQIFTNDVGAGAIYESSRVLHRFYEELQESNITYNPGIIGGGTAVKSIDTSYEIAGKVNIVADTAIVNGDLRFLSEEQKEKTQEKMREIVSESLPGTYSEIIFKDYFPAMPPTEGNLAVLKTLSELSEDLGLGEVKPLDVNKRGAGDISFVAQYVDGLDGLGAQGEGSHAPDENVNLNTLDQQIKRAALLIYRLTREEKD